MLRFTSRRGFDLRLRGEAPVHAEPTPGSSSVAVAATAHAGLRARPLVEPGQAVRAGDALFAPRRDAAAIFVAPVDGVVTEVREGARRRLLCVVLDPAPGARSEWACGEPVSDAAAISSLGVDALRGGLQAAGLWPAFRERPGERLPATGANPDAVLVTAMETGPLAPAPRQVIRAERMDFLAGVAAVARFAPKATWVCSGEPAVFDASELPPPARLATFAGPHPSGLPGTHIAHLAPLSAGRTAWHIGWQDILAVGHWLRTGCVRGERQVAVAGPGAAPPRTLSVVGGARVDELLHGEEGLGPVIAGSLWSGRPAMAPREHLGPFDRMVTLPGEEAFGAEGLRWRTDTPRRVTGMLAVETLDRAWALDVPAAPLLRALMVGDEETALGLGALDLAEEDLALATALGPGGHDFGAYLRALLDRVCGEVRR